MARLGLSFFLVVILTIYIHINECKPIFIPAGFLEQAWPKDMAFPIDRLVRKSDE
jgi:hypothetical protein